MSSNEHKPPMSTNNSTHSTTRTSPGVTSIRPAASRRPVSSSTPPLARMYLQHNALVGSYVCTWRSFHLMYAACIWLWYIPCSSRAAQALHRHCQLALRLLRLIVNIRLDGAVAPAGPWGAWHAAVTAVV
jgi:hypothetical protein